MVIFHSYVSHNQMVNGMFIGCSLDVNGRSEAKNAWCKRPALVPPIPGLVYLWPGVPMPRWADAIPAEKMH